MTMCVIFYSIKFVNIVVQDLNVVIILDIMLTTIQFEYEFLSSNLI